jgi:hypothetical protein
VVLVAMEVVEPQKLVQRVALAVVVELKTEPEVQGVLEPLIKDMLAVLAEIGPVTTITFSQVEAVVLGLLDKTDSQPWAALVVTVFHLQLLEAQ